MIPRTIIILSLIRNLVAADDARLLNTIPFIMAHDAGSGYLTQESHIGIKSLVKGWTQTQSGGLGKQLSCGARAFDARPAVNSEGALVWHHGGITVNHSFSDSLGEVTAFCASNPTELVLMTIWDCVGDGCDAAVDAALASRGVVPLTNCSAFKNLTLAQARGLAALPQNGGQLLVVHAPAPPDGEPSCSYSNYLPSNACSGIDEGIDFAAFPTEFQQCVVDTLQPGQNEVGAFERLFSTPYGSLSSAAHSSLHACLTLHRDDLAVHIAVASAAEKLGSSSSSLPGAYRCYDGDVSSAFPLNRMAQYLDNTSSEFESGKAAAAGNGQLWQMQAIWQESTASVVLGTLSRSTLLDDEARSSWNSKLAADVASGRWASINLLEVNNVCDGGPALREALLAWSSSS